MTRSINDRDLAYERISGVWTEKIDNYDTRRRVEVLVDKFLGRDRLVGRTCLDACCGMGDFPARLRDFGPAALASCDLATTLVGKVRERVRGTDAFVADLLELDQVLADRTFDVIVSSEDIEHTPDPKRAVEQLARGLKPGGYLSISVPNRR